MKLKSGYFTTEYQGRQLLLASGAAAAGFQGVVRSNETAAFIVDRLKTETTEAEIVAALLEVYDVAPEIAARDVRRIVDKLNGIGALE